MVIYDSPICLAVVLCDVDEFSVISLVSFSKFSSVLAVYFMLLIASVLSCTMPVRRNFSYKLEKLWKIDYLLSGTYII